MFPYITIINKRISSYSVMVIIGALLCGFLACYLAKKENEDDNNMIMVLLIASIGAFVGGHLLYGITNINLIIKIINNFNTIDSFGNFIDVFVYIFGGSVFYGGLLGALISGFLYIRLKKLNKSIYYDIAGIITPLFHFFGRIGCFLVGCCYGIESKVGFIFHSSLIESANNIRRFPVQLLESFYNLLLFLLIYYLYRKKILKGKLLYVYLLLYSFGRFILEFFRGDSYRGFIIGLSTSQFISILIFMFTTIILIKKKKI